LEASQGHQKWYILYVRYGFLLMCYSKSVSRTVFEIFDFKNAVILKTALGAVMVIGNVTIRWSAYNFLLTFYITMCLSHVVARIFNVVKYRDL